MNGRIKQQGTSIGHTTEPPVERHTVSVTNWTPEMIDQHMAQYPAWKLRLPEKETLFERTIRPRRGEQA